jgi:hypothetical protein
MVGMNRWQFSLQTLLFVIVPLGLAALILGFSAISTFRSLNDFTSTIAVVILVVLSPVFLGVLVACWNLLRLKKRESLPNRWRRMWWKQRKR